MNVEDLTAFYEYVIESRRRFLDSYRELGWEEFAENREASWDQTPFEAASFLIRKDARSRYHLETNTYASYTNQIIAHQEKRFEEIAE